MKNSKLQIKNEAVGCVRVPLNFAFLIFNF